MCRCEDDRRTVIRGKNGNVWVFLQVLDGVAFGPGDVGMWRLVVVYGVDGVAF
jgi:hypothetical protein